MFTIFLEDYSWLMAVFCFISIFLLWLRRAPMPLEQNRPVADWERSIIMPKATESMAGASARLSRQPSRPLQHRAMRQPVAAKQSSAAFAAAEHMEEDLFDFESGMLDGGIVLAQTSVLQQAQFWSDLGMPGETIAILSPILADESTPGSWLLLMDAYVRCGLQGAYEDVSARFSTQFNGQVPTWEERQLSHTQKGLNDYPELRLRINQRLNQGGGSTWLKQLLRDDRAGKRLGFEYGVYCDLVRLCDSLDACN
jgi:hypothetical protein